MSIRLMFMDIPALNFSVPLRKYQFVRKRALHISIQCYVLNIGSERRKYFAEAAVRYSVQDVFAL